MNTKLKKQLEVARKLAAKVRESGHQSDSFFDDYDAQMVYLSLPLPP